MWLLDKPLEREQKNFSIDMLKGNIARICVSDDVEEIVCQLGFAVYRLSILAYSRVKELKQEKGGETK